MQNNHTYRFQELCTDGFEMLTTIEVPLKGCHDQLWSYASLLTMHVVQHVDEVTQTKKVLEPKECAKYHELPINTSSVTELWTTVSFGKCHRKHLLNCRCWQEVNTCIIILLWYYNTLVSNHMA